MPTHWNTRKRREERGIKKKSRKGAGETPEGIY